MVPKCSRSCSLMRPPSVERGAGAEEAGCIQRPPSPRALRLEPFTMRMATFDAARRPSAPCVSCCEVAQQKSRCITSGSLVQEALAMHEGRFAHGVEHEDVRWWEVVSLHHGDHALHGCPPWRPRCVRPKRCATPSIVPAPGSTLRASILRRERSLGACRFAASLGEHGRDVGQGGRHSLMLTRRAEDVPEGVHHLWIHEGALNLPDVALGDEPLLVVSVDSTFCRLCLARKWPLPLSLTCSTMAANVGPSTCSTSTNRF